jgi:uncharacterized membrane protein YebE (DUF533 family)
MIDPNKLLKQFLGTPAADKNSQHPGQQQQSPFGALGNAIPGAGGFTGGAVAGGILGLLLGSKKARKMAGGLVGYGGAAAVGALAYKAYQNWQQGKAADTAPLATPADLAQVDPRFVVQAPSTGSSFGLVLITAMVAAAKADGHIDANEQTRIFTNVEKLGLDAESKALVFDLLHKPVDLAALCQSVNGVEQASEVYLVSRVVTGGDHPAERAYLEALASRLALPADLVAHLDHQVVDAA